MSASGVGPNGGPRLPRFRPLIVSGSLSDHQYSTMQNLAMQVYPLRANMAALRRFIDSYLNFVDDVERPPFHFQPAIPYVFLQLMHYPWLSVSTENLSAFEQHELSFSIPLECYAKEDGVLVFKQFAMCSPFLYLDKAVSIVAGRDLFGLPKIALKFAPVHPPDLPTAPSQQVALQLRVPGSDHDVYVPFIDIFRDPRPFTSGRQTPADSVTVVPDAIRAYFSAAAEEWYTLVRFPSGGYEQARDIQSMTAMGSQGLQSFSGLLPMFPLYRLAPPPYRSTADVLLGPSYMDIISLKQVRDAQCTDLVAFQSVVRSTMYLDRFYDFGWLFGPLSDDPTTDIRINVHNLRGQNVIQSLGLDVHDERGDGANRISVIKPRFPYWVRLDLVYGLGTNLYWRGRNNTWSIGEEPNREVRFKNRYSTFGGGAQQENPLCVVSPEGLVYVATLPLTANGRDHLRNLCSRYLQNDRYEFRVCTCAQGGPFVWLITRRIHDSGVGRGPASEQEVLLGTIVEWGSKGSGAPASHGFMVLYAITDSESRTLSHSEIFGRPVVLGSFENLGAAWPWPAVRRSQNPMMGTQMPDVLDVLAIKSSVLPVLYSGAAPEYRELIRIKASEQPQDQSNTAARPQETPDAFPSSVVMVSLAQVVDCRLPDRDSYQAITMQLMKAKTHKFQERRDYSLYVAFSRYESLPLVRELGLEVEDTKSGPDTTIELVKACRHGWFDTLIEENGSIDFARRLGASAWEYPEAPEDWLSELKKLDSRVAASMEELHEFVVKFAFGARPDGG